MSAIPYLPSSAPFTRAQLDWLNGFLAGMFSDASRDALGAVAPGQQVAVEGCPAVTVLYGSQTGTAETLAKRIAKQAQGKGCIAKAWDLAEYPKDRLAGEERVLLVTSTYGDGEPPDNAVAFWKWLRSDEAPRLDRVSFAVLALGDTNYAGFCQFGRECDRRLEELGGRRLWERVDCDVEYEEKAAAWTRGVFGVILQAEAGEMAAEVCAGEVVAMEGAVGGSSYGKANPFGARLLVNRVLNGEGSAKEVRHYEFSLAGSGLEYAVGDALGVVPRNSERVVQGILSALGWNGRERVEEGGAETLEDWLLRRSDVSRPSGEMFELLAERGSLGGKLKELLAPERAEEWKAFQRGRELVDYLEGMAGTFSVGEFVGALKKLQPRLYSISSSPKAHEGEVHLTVAAVRYESHGRRREGVCSTFLADRVALGAEVPVYIQPSHGFRLPASGDVPVIMCGPGTGIAPFRAFLEEREACGAKGGNWLFFGDQRRETDFLYREQLEGWLLGGHLRRLDVAFSRDQEAKVYVQHRMLEQGPELWRWLEEGAHFYVCGDASRMARDVDAALVEVAREVGGLRGEEAEAYVRKMRTEKRYQRDVY